MLKLILSIAIYLFFTLGMMFIPPLLERSFLMEYSLFSDYLITPIWLICALIFCVCAFNYAEAYKLIVDTLDKYITD